MPTYGFCLCNALPLVGRAFCVGMSCVMLAAEPSALIGWERPLCRCRLNGEGQNRRCFHVSVKGFDSRRRFSGVASRTRLRARNGQSKSHAFVLLNVQNISAMELAGAAMGSDWEETASQASAKGLKEAAGKSEAAGIVFKTLVRTGQPAEAIARVAREEDIKHIVMGTRGLGSNSRPEGG